MLRRRKKKISTTTPTCIFELTGELEREKNRRSSKHIGKNIPKKTTQSDIGSLKAIYTHTMLRRFQVMKSENVQAGLPQSVSEPSVD